jgi:hypothetical protein
MFKLGVKVPEALLCVQYLKEIAKENNINWDENVLFPKEEIEEENEIKKGINEGMNYNSEYENNMLLLQKQQELIKKQQEMLQKGNSIQSSGINVDFNPESLQTKQRPDFVTNNNSVFQNQENYLTRDDLMDQSNQLMKLKEKLKSSNEDTNEVFDESYFDDFDKQFKQFENKKKIENHKSNEFNDEKSKKNIENHKSNNGNEKTNEDLFFKQEKKKNFSNKEEEEEEDFFNKKV